MKIKTDNVKNKSITVLLNKNIFLLFSQAIPVITEYEISVGTIYLKFIVKVNG